MEKKPSVALIFIAMRITLAHLLTMIFVFTSYAHEVIGQEVLNRTISLTVEKTRLKNVFAQIELSADVKFVYSSRIIDANRRISFSVNQEKLGELLDNVICPLNIGYKVIDDQIILFPKPNKEENATGIPVHGRITDESGTPLPGATVQVKGTGNKTLTDEKGIFVLNNIDQQAVLVITYVGYINKEVTVNNNSEINITLNESSNKLNEVVVVGYGSVKKKDLVGAVDVISAKDAGATTSTNPSQLLIGKSAGVQVIQANGTPGSDAQIIIRGTGSFQNVDPLYVIDGIQGDKNLFNSLSSQDIQNITILKDASSTAIYGSAAANGVVIITTKKGKPGTAKISFLSQWGTASAWKQMSPLNAAQYIDLLKDFATTSNTALPAKFNTPAVLVDSNNWQKQIFRSGLVSENDINVSGGSDKVLYTFSVGYITQQSIVKDLTNKRLNARLGLDETVGRFHFGQSLNIRQTNTSGQMASVRDALGYAPYKPIKDPNILGGYSIVSNVEDFSNVPNPIQEISVTHPVSKEFVFFPQLFGEVNLIKGLRFRSQFSGEFGGGKQTNYQYPYTSSNYLTYARQANLGYYDYSFYTLENYFSYDKTIDKHNLSLTIGMSYQNAGNAANLSAQGSNLPNDNIQNISVAPTQTVTGSGYNSARASVISYYGRINYIYNNKYILTGSIRRDGASNFGINNRYGNFPGIGAAWRFSEEDFMKSAPFISEGKLRVGWGRTGNNSIPNFQTVPFLFGGSPTGNLVYSLGSTETFIPGITVNSLANPFLKWEQTDQTDVGLDLGFLKGRLNLTADWYDRKSSGLLVSVPIPSSTGIGNTGAQPNKTENAADAENKGLELTIGYHDNISSDLNFNISVNGAWNNNKVLSLGSQFTAPIKAGSFGNLSTFTYTGKGSPIGSFYGYRVDHVAKDQAEIDALNQEAAKKTGNPAAIYQAGLLPGDFIFKDLNGNGQVSDSDQVVLGNPIPKFLYGFNAGLNYKNFDFNLVIFGVAGLKLLNAMKFSTLTEATGHNATTGILNRWRKAGDVASLPRAGQSANASGNLRASDWWLENGDYFRIRNITIGYSIGKHALQALGGNVFSRIRIYIAAQNLLTITKYSGYDPEVSTQTGGNYIFSRGIDDGQLPQPRTFLAGLQLGF